MNDKADDDAANEPRPVVVFMINSLAGGGAERVMATLLSASLPWKRHYDIHLVLLDIEQDAYSLPEWLTVHRLDSRFSLYRALRLVLPLLRRLGPVVCLSFLTRANIVAIVAASLFGFRAIVSERVSPLSHHGNGIRGMFARWVTRLLYPLAARIISPSAGVAADLVNNFRILASRNVVIPNPLDQNAICRRAAEVACWIPPAPYIVAVGRLVENKNFALLITALGQSRVPLHLVILGEGHLRDTLEEQAMTSGVADRVHFPGFLENPFPIVRQAAFFVSASRAEGFPNALLEAMVLGVPVISSNCRSGPSEILDERESLVIDRPYDGRYGMLVPVGDTAAMVEAIEKMMQHDTRSRYGSAALSGADRFADTAVPQRYWDIIEQEIAGRA